MPSELWDLFWLNRDLLNQITKLAADCIMTLASKLDVVPAIFTALHTFGRDLKYSGLKKSGNKKSSFIS